MVLESIPIAFKKSVRAKRLRIALSTRGVEVIIPRWVSKRRAERFLSDNQLWVEQRWDRIQSQLQALPYTVSLHYVSEEKMLYRGEVKRLWVGSSDVVIPEISIDSELFKVMLPSYIAVTDTKKIKAVIEKFLKRNLESTLDNLIPKYSHLLKLYPNKVTIRKQKTRWGSCSSQGGINFNLALIMAPDAVLEYVVVHELCHLKHPNHSKEFWSLVATIIPDYKQQQQWLKTHAGIIEVL